MIEQVQFFVFAAVLGVAACGGLLLYSRRWRGRERLLRRLGELDSPSALLGGGRGESTDQPGVRQLLADSGLGWTMADLLSRLLLAGATGALFGVFLGSSLLAVVLALTAIATVFLVVRAARARRIARCDAQLPQALEVMVLALRAGHPLPSAVALAAQEAPAPIADELKRVVDEHRLGRPLTDAVAAMGDRLPACPTVNALVVAVLVLRDTGGNLITVIDRIVQNARARKSYETRLRAMTAEGLMSAKLLAAMPLVFALVAAATDATYVDTMFHDGTGRVVTVIATLWWLLGIWITRRLIRTVS